MSSSGRHAAEGDIASSFFHLLAALSCLALGHHADNQVFWRAGSCARKCLCGARQLREDGTITRVRHNVACFLGHHTYVRAGQRDDHHEYVCVRCGHPLLFQASDDPFAAESFFDKKARYHCSFFGHRVHYVTDRDDFVEYACDCGHTFLKQGRGMTKVTHPMICVLAGHFVRFVTHRRGYAEFVCRHCGHPFCFAEDLTIPSCRSI